MKKTTFNTAYELYENTVKSEEFKELYRLKETAFTRTRKLSFFDIMNFICGTRKHRIQAELESYFAAKGENSVSRQAFSKARELIDPRAFTALNDYIIRNYESTCKSIKKYNGYRLIAVDGTNIDLPNNESTKKFFGYSTNATSKEYAKGLAIAAYDVLNKITIFAELYRYDDSEKRRILDIADGFKMIPAYDKCLFLLDRGYPSFALFKKLSDNNQKYLIRVSSQSLREINDSNKPDSVIQIKRNFQKIKVRIVNVVLPTGETEKLVTNLFDFDKSAFKDLYSMRWGVETSFNFIKNKQLLETFTGESIIAIRQDFYAAVLMMNMASFAYSDQEDTIKTQAKNFNRKLSYKPNFSQLIYDIKLAWTELFIGKKSRKMLNRKLNDYARIMAYAYADIPDRHFPREFGTQHAHRKSHTNSPM